MVKIHSFYLGIIDLSIVDGQSIIVYSPALIIMNSNYIAVVIITVTVVDDHDDATIEIAPVQMKSLILKSS